MAMNAGVKVAAVVGVDHRIQYTNADCGPEWTSDIRAFEDYLVDQASSHDVDLLAEEFSEEAVRKNNATTSPVQEAARRAHKPHLFMDPDTVERDAAGITTGAQRESEWLQRLRLANVTRLLIVCGDDHVDSFAQRLDEDGFRTTVLSRGWGYDWMTRN